MEVLKIAAFSDGEAGGNPAGVVIRETLPSATVMHRWRLMSAFPKPHLPRHRAKAGGYAIFRRSLRCRSAAMRRLRWARPWPEAGATAFFLLS